MCYPRTDIKGNLTKLLLIKAFTENTNTEVLNYFNIRGKVVKQDTQNILGIGEKLTQVQELLRHDKKGGFRTWLEAEFGLNYRTGYNFIRVWEKFGNCEKFSQLDIAISALYLLAAPSTPEPALRSALEQALSGVRITHKKSQKNQWQPYLTLSHQPGGFYQGVIKLSAIWFFKKLEKRNARNFKF